MSNLKSKCESSLSVVQQDSNKSNALLTTKPNNVICPCCGDHIAQCSLCDKWTDINYAVKIGSGFSCQECEGLSSMANDEDYYLNQCDKLRDDAGDR